MANDYKVGQVWEDSEGDRWTVAENLPGVGFGFVDMSGIAAKTDWVEEDFGPLKWVEDVPVYKDYGYITKDSGERAEYSSGMVRDTNTDKARFDLLVPRGVHYQDQFLTRVADLMARGAVKYSARNWEQANSDEELDRFRESAFRHLVQWLSGDLDEDHAAAVVFNLMAYETTLTKLNTIESL